MKRACSAAALALVALFGPALGYWILHSEMTHLHWALPGVALVWLALFGLHHLVFGPAPFRGRLLRVAVPALVLASAVLVLSFLLRYEGSVSGTSYPKLAWAWDSAEEPAPVGEPVRYDGARAAGADFGGEWPEFLGPGRNGVGPPPAFGTDWMASPPAPLWRRPVGKGWSSFAVSGGRALTQEQRGDDEHVTCLDLASGEEIWTHADRGVRLLLERAENAGAAMGGDGPRATPTIRGERVYVMGSTGLVHCLELETGELVWSRPLLRELGAGPHRWGMANSPLVTPDSGLVVFAGRESRGATLVACDASSGETFWTYQGRGASYSSPRWLSLCAREQIVAVNQDEICGLDPDTGEALWTHPWPGAFPKVGQPIDLPGDRLLVSASYGAGSLLLQLSRDAEGAFAVSELWKSTRLKTKFSSAAVFGDHAYGLDEGRLACVDLKKGERIWKREKFGFGQHLLLGDRLLVQTESGEVVFGRIGPDRFEETGRLPALSSMTWNAPAVAGRVLLVRNDREAAAYLLPEP